jgi:hypothetical protein
MLEVKQIITEKEAIAFDLKQKIEKHTAQIGVMDSDTWGCR